MVLRLWLTRRWLLATLIALLFALACFFLGRWQWSRYVEKRTKVTAIEAHYAAPPVPLEAALSVPLTPERQWSRVRITGAYAAGADLLARNRPLDNVLGYEVLTSLTTDSGHTLLVDRGWVQSGGTAATTPTVQAPPAGPVKVTGWLRSGEVSLGKEMPRGQLASINIADARAQRPQVDPTDVYVVLQAQAPAPPRTSDSPLPLPRPEESLGPHQAYAFQWWLTMPGGLVFVGWAIRRELAERDELTESGRPARPKKVRIWDEEDA